jgi:hypothetical protein
MPNHELTPPGAPLQTPLRYARPPDLGPACRALPRVDILNTRDEHVGVFDGILLSADSDKPLFLVFQRQGTNSRRLIPIGSAWLDPTAKVIRVDPADADGATPFELSEFERMTPTEVVAFERRVLASCCPEVLRDAERPAYETADRFRCPDWLSS